MTFNEGRWDRVIRILVGLALGYSAWAAWPGSPSVFAPTGIAGLAYLIVGVEVFVTGAIGWSPVYALFGFSTKARVGA